MTHAIPGKASGDPAGAAAGNPAGKPAGTPAGTPRLSAAARLRLLVRRRGLWGAVRRLTRQARGRWLERRLGIVTRASIDARQLGAVGSRFGYQPIDHHSFQAAMRAVGWSKSDVFADLGCGMGRAVFLAARLGLRRVIGVERSPELCQAARQNLQRARPRLKTKDVQIVCSDATAYEVPDDLSLVFMFNPFGGEVMQAVLARLRQSLQRRPRPLQIVYALPLSDKDLLADCGWLAPVRAVPTDNPDWERITIYRCRDAPNAPNAPNATATAPR